MLESLITRGSDLRVLLRYIIIITMENSLNFQQEDHQPETEIVIPAHKEDNRESGKRISDIEGALEILENEENGEGEEDITPPTLQ